MWLLQRVPRGFGVGNRPVAGSDGGPYPGPAPLRRLTEVYFRALGLTLAVELGAMVVVAPVCRLARARALSVVLATNLVVHPVFWHGFRWVPGEFPVNLWLAEGLVVAVEAAVYRLAWPTSWTIAIALACALNTASALLGMDLSQP